MTEVKELLSFARDKKKSEEFPLRGFSEILQPPQPRDKNDRSLGMTQRSREALAVLCSVVKHTGSGRAQKSVRRNTRRTELPREKQETYGAP